MRLNEFMKRSEARILTYLNITDCTKRDPGSISRKLDIDYSYLMKLLQDMYNKGWIGTHKYDKTTYFFTTARAPLDKANDRLFNGQVSLEQG